MVSFLCNFFATTICRSFGGVADENCGQLARYTAARMNGESGVFAGQAHKAGGGILSSLFGGDADKADNTAQDQPQQHTIPSSNSTINVFSLASGHLYERFLSIMMRTVRSTTQVGSLLVFVLVSCCSLSGEFLPPCLYTARFGSLCLFRVAVGLVNSFLLSCSSPAFVSGLVS